MVAVSLYICVCGMEIKMERFESIEEISDGKKYTPNDMVKIGCSDCAGCHACCTNVGNTITLDPYDIYRLTKGLNTTFQNLLMDKIELNVDRGMIIPNIKMDGELKKCNFLNAEGRCSVHSLRPGICRLFPMGRHYENGSFSYFLQVGECKYVNKTKVKLKKWLDTENLAVYEKYINDWHYFTRDIQQMLETQSEESAKKINMYLLNEFYIVPYENNDFYGEFYSRLDKIKRAVYEE